MLGGVLSILLSDAEGMCSRSCLEESPYREVNMDTHHREDHLNVTVAVSKKGHCRLYHNNLQIVW